MLLGIFSKRNGIILAKQVEGFPSCAGIRPPDLDVVGAACIVGVARQQRSLVFKDLRETPCIQLPIGFRRVRKRLITNAEFQYRFYLRGHFPPRSFYLGIKKYPGGTFAEVKPRG